MFLGIGSGDDVEVGMIMCVAISTICRWHCQFCNLACFAFSAFLNILFLFFANQNETMHNVVAQMMCSQRFTTFWYMQLCLLLIRYILNLTISTFFPVFSFEFWFSKDNPVWRKLTVFGKRDFWIVYVC